MLTLDPAPLFPRDHIEVPYAPAANAKFVGAEIPILSPARALDVVYDILQRSDASTCSWLHIFWQDHLDCAEECHSCIVTCSVCIAILKATHADQARKTGLVAAAPEACRAAKLLGVDRAHDVLEDSCMDTERSRECGEVILEGVTNQHYRAVPKLR